MPWFLTWRKTNCASVLRPTFLAPQTKEVPVPAPNPRRGCLCTLIVRGNNSTGHRSAHICRAPASSMTDQHEPASPELSSLDPTPVSAAPAPAADASTSPTEASPALPPKPPRPLSPHSQAKATLVEAFPNVDEGVIEAVLVASGGNVEPAFHALLGMLARGAGCLTAMFRHD
jgi:hypothetical protein